MTSPRDPTPIVADPKRLAAVRATRLLDTPAEESFDRLTALAARLLGVPATFLSLVDEGRDFYKSCIGFDEPLASTRQIEGRTFCHYAVASTGPLLIEDTLTDPVFSEVPTVRSLGVRAYAGIPLVTTDGQTIGSFCAIDFHPRRWSAVDVEVLTELSRSAMREIDLRQGLRERQGLIDALTLSNRDLEDFAHAASHDLKGPLRGIVVLAEMIADDLGTAAPAEATEKLTLLRERALRLNALLEGILGYSRLIRGKRAVQRVDTAVLLGEVVDLLAPEEGVSVVVEDGMPMVLADRAALQQVFLNLIGNALKHAPLGVLVRVRARLAAPGVHEFLITDDGPGIALEHQERIFKMFQRLSHDPSGHGIGLALVQKLVSQRGGRISVESTLGHGATFRFTWPDGA